MSLESFSDAVGDEDASKLPLHKKIENMMP
jgi:hypothetical protein